MPTVMPCQIQAKEMELEELRAVVSGKEGEIEAFKSKGMQSHHGVCLHTTTHNHTHHTHHTHQGLIYTYLFQLLTLRG